MKPFNSQEWVKKQIKKGHSFRSLSCAMASKRIVCGHQHLRAIAAGKREFSRKLEREIAEKWN